MTNGGEADGRRRSEEDKEQIFYVDNIFIRLNDVYLKKKQSYYESDVHDRMILSGVTMFLQQLKKDCPLDKSVTHKTYLYYHFAITIPTYWDHGIREELLRPLFIQAGLISEDDHHDKLLIFTQLESNFRYLQSLHYDARMNTKIGNGRQYIMYGLRFIGNNLIMTMNFFSAHYPPVTTVDDNYVTKVLKSVHFTVLLDSKRTDGKYPTN